MKYTVLSARTFFHPFYLKTFITIVLLCFILTVVNTFAVSDVEQTDLTDVRQAVKQAKKLVKKGDLNGAEAILRPIVNANPKQSAAKVDLAYILLKKKHLLEAYDLSYKVVQDEPKNAHAFAVLGATLLSAGNFKAASPAVYAALALDRREALAWAALGLLNFYENQIPKSLEYLNQAIYYAPDEPDFVFAYAQTATRAEKYKEAADAYQKYLEISNETDKNRRDRIKGLVSFLRYLGNQNALYVLDGKDRTSININLIGNRPVIELKINNSDEPLHFVLDTGSNISVVSEAAAERLNIRPVARGGYASGIGGDGKFEIIYGLLRSVDVGDVRVRNVPVYIRKFHQTSEKIDGYIGLSLISQFLTTLDYGNLTFSLTRKNTANGVNVGSDALSQALHLTPSGFLSGEVQIQGIEVPLNFIVDTGASVSVVSDALAKNKQFDEMTKGENMSVIGAAGITNNVPSFLLPRISFGNNSLDKVMAISLDLDIINENAGFEQSGILGGNFLKNYRLIFDFEKSKVIFMPIEQRK